MKVLNQQLIKQNNLKKLYTLVGAQKGVSRAQLASQAQLSRTTVGVLVDELINGGYLVDDGEVDTGKQGRKPSMLYVDGKSHHIAVIDWRPKIITAALVALNGTTACYHQQEAPEDGDYLQATVLLHQWLRAQLAPQQTILALCIVLPSIIDHENERLFSCSLPIQNLDTIIAQAREQIKSVPLAFFNDTACYAYAEKATPEWCNVNSAAYINMSGGVGAITFLEGKMLGGASSVTTEFGHVSVDRNGEVCECGNRGCLEMRVGELMLEKNSRKIVSPERMQMETQPLTYKRLGELAAQGEAEFCLLVDSLAEDLAFALSNLITVCNVGQVVIGGHGQFLGDLFLKKLRHHCGRFGFQGFVSRVNIRYTMLDDRAFLHGASMYFMNTKYQFLSSMRNALLLF